MAKDALVQELVDGFDDWPAQPRPEEPASAGSVRRRSPHDERALPL